jgi:hypothetical protein
VFVGIAGVMAGEQAETAQSGGSQPTFVYWVRLLTPWPETPTVSTRGREAGDELRELYRKTIAAGFSSQPGELSADHVIEEIFSGGDGFGRRRDSRAGGGGGGSGGKTASGGRRSSMEHQRSAGDAGYWSDGGDVRSVGAADAGAGGGAGAKDSWPDFGYGKRGARANRERLRSADEVFRSGGGGGGAIGRPRGSFGSVGHAAEMDKAHSVPEVDELDVRDDLRCWNSRVWSRAADWLDPTLASEWRQTLQLPSHFNQRFSYILCILLFQTVLYKISWELETYHSTSHPTSGPSSLGPNRLVSGNIGATTDHTRVAIHHVVVSIPLTDRWLSSGIRTGLHQHHQLE